MQWRLCLGDLNFGGCKAKFLCALDQPPREESLTTAVFTANRFEHTPTGSNLLQLFIQR